MFSNVKYQLINSWASLSRSPTLLWGRLSKTPGAPKVSPGGLASGSPADAQKILWAGFG